MEIIDIVDSQDNVIWQIERKQCYIDCTTNRIVSILLFNNEWKLALQKRSKTSSFMPWALWLSAWWHVSTWETYEIAARKELQEELWIEVPLEMKYKLYDNRAVVNWKYHKHSLDVPHYFFEWIFEWIYNWDFYFNTEENDEVDDVRFFSLEEIKEMIEKEVPMMPNLSYILKKYYF